MKKVTVEASLTYDVIIDKGILERAGELCAGIAAPSRAVILTDTNVAPLYADRVRTALEHSGFAVRVITLPAGEQTKNPDNLSRLWDVFTDFGLTRTDAVVALGGGVIGDLAGFAAATILRGVDYVQIPTTLLAQVDSSVGGKVAIDLPAGKNLAGAFHQPRLVLMDPDVLNTLDDKTFSDGMAEVIKYGCIRDGEFFAFLEQHASRSELMKHIEQVLFTCCDLKRQLVTADERDTGVRMLLNFGHTLGHAYESAGNYEAWTHGQAVAAGMVKAAQLGHTLGVTPDGTAGRIAALLEQFGLPTAIDCTRAQYADAIALDKKGSGEDLSLIVLKSIGNALIHKLPRAEVPDLL